MEAEIYYQPTTVEAALELKGWLGDRGSFLAGGTGLVPGMVAGDRDAGALIDLGRIPALDRQETAGDRLRIRSGTRYADLEGSDVSAIAGAIRRLGSPQIRNQATVGGALGAARPDGDFPVVLLALDAEVKLASIGGERTVPLDGFFTGPGATVLGPDEMILEVSFRRPSRSAFLKVTGRRGQAYSLVCAAASLSEDGRVRLAAGGVASAPIRLHETEEFLSGVGPSPDTVARAAEIAAGEARPVSDPRASADYRRAMCGVLANRLLSGIGLEGETHAHAS